MTWNQFLSYLIPGIINGLFLMAGMMLGTKLTARNVRHEIDDLLEKSETFSMIRNFLSDQELTSKATEFFEEANQLVKSKEAKNFFKNTTELMKRMSEKQEGHEMPAPPPSSSTQKT